MVIETLAPRRQSGAASAALIALTSLGGFAAGALVVGVIAFERHPAPGSGALVVAEPYRAASPASQSLAVEPPLPVSAASPWYFETAAPRPRAGPGRTRPDLFSAPEGWTYDASRK